MTSFHTYLFGFIVLIIGIGAAAYLLGVPAVWIAVGVVILIGLAIMSASNFTDTRPPPD
jgi:heme A synthase